MAPPKKEDGTANDKSRPPDLFRRTSYRANPSSAGKFQETRENALTNCNESRILCLQEVGFPVVGCGLLAFKLTNKQEQATCSPRVRQFRPTRQAADRHRAHRRRV